MKGTGLLWHLSMEIKMSLVLKIENFVKITQKCKRLKRTQNVWGLTCEPKRIKVRDFMNLFLGISPKSLRDNDVMLVNNHCALHEIDQAENDIRNE